MAEQKPNAVLIVDDDQDVCNIFQLVLQHYDVPVVAFPDGKSALEHLEKSHAQYDIVVMDLFLPDMDGYQVLKRIQAAHRWVASKFIATTAYHTKDTVNEVIGNGFDGYLSKPIAVEEIMPYLTNILSGT